VEPELLLVRAIEEERGERIVAVVLSLVVVVKLFLCLYQALGCWGV
jgi:hypothetical protein